MYYQIEGGQIYTLFALETSLLYFSLGLYGFMKPLANSEQAAMNLDLYFSILKTYCAINYTFILRKLQNQVENCRPMLVYEKKFYN